MKSKSGIVGLIIAIVVLVGSVIIAVIPSGVFTRVDKPIPTLAMDDSDIVDTTEEEVSTVSKAVEVTLSNGMLEAYNEDRVFEIDQSFDEVLYNLGKESLSFNWATSVAVGDEHPYCIDSVAEDVGLKILSKASPSSEDSLLLFDACFIGYLGGYDTLLFAFNPEKPSKDNILIYKSMSKSVTNYEKGHLINVRANFCNIRYADIDGSKVVVMVGE